MKILVLSDIHGRTENLKQILKKAHGKGIGLAIITGDLTNYGEKKQVQEILEELKNYKTMAVPGNMDTKKALQEMEAKKISIHGKNKKIGKWNFAGFGGGITGHIGEILHTEEQIEKTLEKTLERKEKTVLVTHLPPKNTSIDLAHGKMHAGSTAIRKIIEQKQPTIHVCGHIHEALGEDKIGTTTTINAGAVKEGKALILNLGDEITWERIKL